VDLNDFGALQLRVLEMLWEGGPASAGDLWEGWPGRPRPAYTTVLSALQKLYRRKLVRRRKRGRSHVYTPRVDRESFRRRFVAEIREKFFGGSAAGIVAALLGDEKISAEELREMEHLLSAAAPARRKVR
jgi:predicted transcriptional regulator